MINLTFRETVSFIEAFERITGFKAKDHPAIIRDGLERLERDGHTTILGNLTRRKVHATIRRDEL